MSQAEQPRRNYVTVGEISRPVRRQLRHRLHELAVDAREMREDLDELSLGLTGKLRARLLADDLSAWISDLARYRDRLLAEVQLIEDAQITSALCRHCGAKILPAGAWWEDENGLTACVKGQPVENPQPGQPVFTAPVLHEPMPTGLEGGPQ